jgi:hypothetical protein
MCPGEAKETAGTMLRLRICFVSPYPPRFGGIATYSHELVEGIKKRGHEVCVICDPDLDEGGHAGQENVYPVMDARKRAGLRTFLTSSES